MSFVSGSPFAITNCVNFASPERPEVMWSFSEVVDRMAEACRALDTPVVSGNVSFYNETEGRGILPTPVIGMIGLVEDVRRVLQPGFKEEGDTIALLGATSDDLSISDLLRLSLAFPPSNDRQWPGAKVRYGKGVRVQAACLEAAEAGLSSAHDRSDGGLAGPGRVLFFFIESAQHWADVSQ